MSAKKSKKKASTKKKTTSPKSMPIWAKHIGAYVILLLAAMLYFRPIAFEGKSLQQHDNLLATATHTEMQEYQKEGQQIRWTNQLFGGMPTTLMSNHNINYINYPIAKTFRLWQRNNEWVCMLYIMFFCYIGLSLLGVNYVLALSLSVALGFFTANTLYIAAGHTGKVIVLSTIPMLMGAFIYAWRKNMLLGAALFTFGLSFNICKNHIQITYYMYFALAIFGLVFLIHAINKKKIPEFSKFAGVMIVATILGIISNLGFIWPNYEYGQESTRGPSNISQKANPQADKDASSGLGYDYVFNLSMEKAEILTLMFPNFYGGTQSKLFVSQEGSATFTAFRSPAVQQEIAQASKRAKAKDVNQFMQQIAIQYTRQYRGSQTMSGGPMYFGVVICLLFILSLMLIRGPMKWAFVGAFVFYVILAWGKHFAIFNDFMYYYFPLYSKFRDTKMTLLAAQPMVILAIGMGLMQLVNFKAEKYKDSLSAKLLPYLKQSVSKEGYVLLAGAIGLGICVLTYLYISFATLSSPKDAELSVISRALVAALQEDRAALAQADIFKAMAFIAAATAILYLYTKKTIRLEIMALLIGALACVDLGIVNSDYLNEDSYVEEGFKEQAKQKRNNPQKSDRDIMKDKSIYNVCDYSRGYPSQSANASFYHKSVGGYFAAKPMLYQELWSYYRMDDGNTALTNHTNIMNMLNVKYIILSAERFMDNPTALGNAWFVENIKTVKDANEEITAIDNLTPVSDAVIQEKFADYVSGITTTKYSPGDNIYLKRYNPDTMTYVSKCAKERFAVFSEMYYPPSKGWTVYIDGEEVDPFIKTNYLLRGLRVPAGEHEIKMVFAPTSINLGRRIGQFSSILIIGLLIFGIYRVSTAKPKEEDEEEKKAA